MPRTNIYGSRLNMENWLQNGNFDTNTKRLDSSPFPTTGSKFFERWGSFPIFGGTGTVQRIAFTQGQTDVPGEPNFYARINKGTADYSFMQGVEDVRKCAQKTFTVSFWARGVGDAIGVIPFSARYRFGPSSITPDNVFFNQNYTLTAGWQFFQFTFTTPDVAGADIQAGDHMGVQVVNFTGIGTGQIHIASVMMNEGNVPGEFNYWGGSLEAEREGIKRYFESSLPVGNLPGSTDVNGGFGFGVGDLPVSSTRFASFNTPFKVEKRVIPTVTLYAPDTGSIGSVTTAGGDAVGTVVGVGTSSFRAQANSSSASAFGTIRVHYTADAEYGIT